MKNLIKTMGLWAFGITKVPLIFSVFPTVEKLDDKECVVKIPLNYWTRNHFKSMYFGTLAIGADCAGGLIALDVIRKKKAKMQPIFKDFKAEFFKRPESDVYFTCKDVDKIKKQIDEAIKTKERVNRTLTIIATTPKKTGDTPVAEFKLTLSLKAKS